MLPMKTRREGENQPNRENIVRSSMHAKFKKISDILLHFETREAQSQKSTKVEVKFRILKHLVKLRRDEEDTSEYSGT